MKTRKLLLGGVLFALCILLVAAGVLGITALFTASSAGIGLAMATAVGTATTETISEQVVSEAEPDLYMAEVRKNIVKIKPSNFALDTVLRNVSGKKSTKSLEVKFYSMGSRELESIVKTTVAATSGSAGTKLHSIVLDNTTFADLNDNIMFQGITDTEDKQNLVGQIVKRDATTGTYTIMLLNGKGANASDIPDITEGTKVSRIGKSMHELDARCDNFASIPEDDFNYCQFLMSTISQGLYEKSMKKEVPFDLSDLKEAAIDDFRAQCEFAALMGCRSIKYNPENNKKYYHMGGIYRAVAKNKVLAFGSESDAKKTVEELSKGIFSGTNGSDTRYMFAGEDIMAWLGMNADYQKQMKSNSVEYKFGIRFNKFETNWGQLLIKPHNSFRFLGLGSQALVIDPEYIELYTFQPMRIRTIDNDKNGTELSTTHVLEESFCPIVLNPDTHAVIKMTA